MLYMVIEHFGKGMARSIYQRAAENGRMMPEGLEYLSSWVDMDFGCCYQLMRTADESLFVRWTDAWKDLIDFEIVPVRTSSDAAGLMGVQI